MDTEEVVAAPPPSSCPLNKGKRTKRQRPLSPIPISAIPAAGATFSGESTTTEEEDTARCLILLARGHFIPKRKRHEETTTLTASAACMYECKTCNRAFQSFQALGGHRASHRKPKNERRSPFFSDEEDYPFFNKKRMPPSPLQLANISAANAAAAAAAGGRGPMKPPHPSPRIHECSYCGAEFTSGQALGGHMRRHRAGPVVSSPNEQNRPGNGLSLDLNLPAPDDENQRFGFGARQQTNTPALLNCHF